MDSERDMDLDDFDDAPEEEADFADFIKVSHRDEVNRLAGKLAWNARRREHMPMLASGSAAINTALEAIAEARKYLGSDDEPSELLCQPAFRDRSMGPALAFYLSSSPTRIDGEDESRPHFTASKGSKPGQLAGAIAARVREGISPVVSAIGEEAVANAVLAACRSRIYLEDDQLDIKFVAIKETIRKTGGDGITKLLPSIELHIQIDEVR